MLLATCFLVHKNIFSWFNQKEKGLVYINMEASIKKENFRVNKSKEFYSELINSRTCLYRKLFFKEYYHRRLLLMKIKCKFKLYY